MPSLPFSRCGDHRAGGSVLLTLGIPTSATAAIMLAAFQIFDLQPGPELFFMRRFDFPIAPVILCCSPSPPSSSRTCPL